MKSLKYIFVIFTLISCGKGQTIGLSEQVNCIHYREVTNYYDLDTSDLIMKTGDAIDKSFLIEMDRDVCDTHIKTDIKDIIISYDIFRHNMDITPETWILHCGVPGQPDKWLQQHYFERNGVRILPKTRFPIFYYK